MPYIKQGDRDKFIFAISELRSQVSKDPQRRPGEINYILSQLFSFVYGEHLKYYDYNEIIGVLECCKLEMYRVKAGPYEDKKLIENGPVT